MFSIYIPNKICSPVPTVLLFLTKKPKAKKKFSHIRPVSFVPHPKKKIAYNIK